ncbi:hypothetical protein XNA1_5110011 [Xenorhabdus nematophila str. Anatoliense]|nr:hypothetical protein XNA1_5110011 [Xenorhabdus nematophila str. Anatoliense]
MKPCWHVHPAIQRSDIVENPCYTGLEADIFARESTVGTVGFVYAYQAMISGVRTVKCTTVNSHLLISRRLHLIC